MKGGGTSDRDALAAVARDADGLEVALPAFAALLCWGQSGIDLILNVALSETTVKRKAGALFLLSQLADQGRILGGELIGDKLAEAVNKKLDVVAIRPAARHALRELILSIPTDVLFNPLNTAMMFLRIAQAPSAIEELLSALSARWIRFGRPAIEQFEQLIANSPADEPAFQEFFSTYPQFLDPMAVQVWTQPDFHGAAEPDFVVRRADDTYLIVEIECPAKLLMTKSGQLSAQATHAEKQVLDYEAFLSDRIAEARTHFPRYARADRLVLIGLESQLSDQQRVDLQRTNASRQQVRIAGFDWALSRARTIISSISDGSVAVVRGHRMI